MAAAALSVDGNLYDDAADALALFSKGEPLTPTARGALLKFSRTDTLTTDDVDDEDWLLNSRKTHFFAFSFLLSTTLPHHSTRLLLGPGTEINLLLLLGDCSVSEKFFGVSLVTTTIFFFGFHCGLTEHKFPQHQQEK